MKFNLMDEVLLPCLAAGITKEALVAVKIMSEVALAKRFPGTRPGLSVLYLSEKFGVKTQNVHKIAKRLGFTVYRGQIGPAAILTSTTSEEA